jgi:ActR/RegA family two-component response regulator
VVNVQRSLSVAPHVHLECLLFGNDAHLLGVMKEVLGNLSMETEVCRELGSALDAVTHKRLDAVIVDWEQDCDPTRIVRATRKSSPNSNATIVAVVNERSETHALLVGANFMIHKPANVDRATRCMRAAYGTMLQNRRRSARVPVDISVEARVVGVGDVTARITDLSIGGLGLQCEQPLLISQDVLIHFGLPGASALVHVSGKVVNANPTGRAGIRFACVPEEHLIMLENWLATELLKLEQAEIPTSGAQIYE